MVALSVWARIISIVATMPHFLSRVRATLPIFDERDTRASLQATLPTRRPRHVDYAHASQHL